MTLQPPGGSFADAEHYDYDANGNRTTSGLTGDEVDYETGDANRMTAAGDYEYQYDPEGNLVARFFWDDSIESGGDGDGLIDDGEKSDITEYAWDHRNRLVGVTTRDAVGSAATLAVEFGYDYLNRWVARTVDLDGDATAHQPEREYFVYDTADTVPAEPGQSRVPIGPEGEPGQVVLQLDAAGNPTHRYLWAQAVDQLLADE